MQIFRSAFGKELGKCQDIIVNLGRKIIVVISDKKIELGQAYHALEKEFGKDYFRIVSATPKEALETGILPLILEGESLKHGKNSAEKLGLQSCILCEYSLSGLTRSQKTLFGYALKGRSGNGGLIREAKGEVIGRNALSIPAKEIEKLGQFMAYWKVEWVSRKIFVETRQRKDDNEKERE